MPDKTTVILSQSWSSIAEPERLLLEKILGAVRLSLDAVRVLHQPAFDMSALSPLPSKLMYFGPAVNGLAQYEVIQTDQSSVVMAGGLSELQPDAAAKKKLWESLRKMYGI
jgi:hypothetical protein